MKVTSYILSLVTLVFKEISLLLVLGPILSLLLGVGKSMASVILMPSGNGFLF